MLNEGRDLVEVLRHLAIAESTWDRWRNRYSGMKGEEAKRLNELEWEIAGLKKLLAEAELDKAMLKELAEGKGDPGTSTDRGQWRSWSNVSGSPSVGPWVGGQCRSTQRRPGRPIPDVEVKLPAGLRQIAREHPRWGWKTVHSVARREG